MGVYKRLANTGRSEHAQCWECIATVHCGVELELAVQGVADMTMKDHQQVGCPVKTKYWNAYQDLDLNR